MKTEAPVGNGKTSPSTARSEARANSSCSVAVRPVLLSVVEEGQDATAVAELLEQAKQRFAGAGQVCEVIEREGKPAFVIGDVADEINADLIVMGTRGIPLESDQQSTAARVIQLAPCPVLVVP